MRSKDHRKYVIVTKKPNYSFWFEGDDIPFGIEENHEEVNDKTFWLYTKKGELVDRYSVESAPKWVMNIYNILVKDVD